MGGATLHVIPLKLIVTKDICVKGWLVKWYCFHSLLLLIMASTSININNSVWLNVSDLSHAFDFCTA